MKNLAYTLDRESGSARLLHSPWPALALLLALVASNLWWLHRAGSFELPAAAERLPRANVGAPVGVQALAQQRDLKLDADGAF